MSISRNFFLCCQDFIADRAVFPFRQAGLSAGGFHPFVNHFGVSIGRNFFLRNQHLIADRAVLPFRQTGLGAGGFRSLVDDLAVPLGRNLLLRSQHFIADGAVRSFRQAGLGAGRLYPLVGHFGVSKSGDSFCPDRRCLRSLLILERSPAGLTDVIGFVAGLGAGGSHRVHQLGGMSEGGQNLCLSCGLLRPLLVFENLAAGGTGEIAVVSVLCAGGSLRLRLGHGVSKSGQDHIGFVCALGQLLIDEVFTAGEAAPIFQITGLRAAGRLSGDVLHIVGMGRSIVDDCLCQSAVIVSNLNLFPLQVRPSIVYMLQLAAAIESRVADAGHAIRNRHAGQAAAAVEGRAADAGHALRNCHAGQAAAAVEGLVVDAGHTLWNRHAGQAAAAVEDRAANAGHTPRNRHACQAAAAREGTAVNAGHTIWNRHTSHATAAPEGTVANAGHTLRNRHAGQAAAAVEGLVANAGHTL